jgi:hypothetical protein
VRCPCARVLEDADTPGVQAGPSGGLSKVRVTELPLVRFESHVGHWARFRWTCSAAAGSPAGFEPGGGGSAAGEVEQDELFGVEGGDLDADVFQDAAGQGDAVLGAPGGGSAFHAGGLVAGG